MDFRVKPGKTFKGTVSIIKDGIATISTPDFLIDVDLFEKEPLEVGMNVILTAGEEDFSVAIAKPSTKPGKSVGTGSMMPKARGKTVC